MGDGASVPVQVRLKSSGLSVGDLSQRVGVRPSAIRYYEACGLLRAPERRSGRRCYDLDAVERLRTILIARRLGFSINEIKVMAAADAQGQRQAAKAKARSLRASIEKLSAAATRLDELSQCDCASGRVCCL